MTTPLLQSVASRGRHERAAQALAALAAPAEKTTYSMEGAYTAFARGYGGGVAHELNEPLDPYRQSQWFFTCVDEIAGTCSGIPVRLARSGPGLKIRAGGRGPEIRPLGRTLHPAAGAKAVCVGRAAEGELVTDGEAAELLAAPNGYLDWPAFFHASVGYLKSWGSVAWVLTDLTGNRPREMHAVNGRHVEPRIVRRADGGVNLVGYTYRVPGRGGQGIPLAPEEVKYFHLWSGSDNPLKALRTAEPGRLALATDYNAHLFNAYTLQNGADPSMVLSFAKNLSPEQRDDFEARLRSRHTGPWRAKLPLVLEGDAKAQAWQTSMSDLQFHEGLKTTRLEICALLRVPPVVAGWVEAAGDSSAYTENALRQFYEQTVFRTLDFFAPALQEIVARFDARLVFYFDVEDQPVVEGMRLAKIAKAKDLWSMGVPLADVNAQLDLGLPDRPWHATGFVPAGLLPAEAAAEAYAVAPEGEPPEGTSLPRAAASAVPAAEAPEERQLDRVWRAWAQAYESLARRGAPMLRVQFARWQRAVLAALEETLPEAEAAPRAAGMAKQDPSPLVGRILLALRRDRDRFRAKVRAYQGDAHEMGARQGLAEAGLVGEAARTRLLGLVENPVVTAELQADAVRVSTLVTAETRRILRGQLTAGLEAGETMSALAERVREVMGNRRRAALLVARNAVGQTLSRARHHGHRAAGLTHKWWMHSRGPGERRPAHVAAESRYPKQDPIEMDAFFEVGEARLLYPRDFVHGTPGECVNCQCVKLAVRPSSEREPSAREIAGAYAGRERPFLVWADVVAARRAEGGDAGNPTDDGEG